MQRALATLMDGGSRLHLQHGPIDLIIGADGDSPEDRQAAFRAAATRFETVLQGLVDELAQHRNPLQPETPDPSDSTARRMYRATRPFCAEIFLTPMIAVAGAVADETLQAMLDAASLHRAYVNNGGDIAVHLAKGEEFSVAMASGTGDDLGRVRFGYESGIGGIATSGTGGRSFSLGIAESVTVLATSAARADVAATLIANAVDLPGDLRIVRVPARDLLPDSDLRERLVVTSLPSLTSEETAQALTAGWRCAKEMVDRGRILGAVMYLQGQHAFAGAALEQFDEEGRIKEIEYA